MHETRTSRSFAWTVLAVACVAAFAVRCRRQDEPGRTASASHPARRVLYYRHPMDASIHSDRPAKDDMGMDYVPVYEDEAPGAAALAGHASIVLSPESRQLLGIQTAPAREEQIDRVVRTVGKVAVAETHIHHLHTKLEGYVEDLYVSYTGQLVKKGDPLLSIYSPELLATQQEYLVAYRARERLAQSRLPDVAQAGADVLESARRRLLLWDVRPADIAALEKAGAPSRALPVYAEDGGYVLEKTAYHGMRVTPMDTLFTIADLRHVWVLADVYEPQLPFVGVGTRATVTTAARPGAQWTGPVTFVAPTVDDATRTVKVRVEIENPDAALKPDMYADVVLRAGRGKALVVPESALVDTGLRRIVFVDHGDGTLEPREVTPGGRTADGVEIASGLARDERVVTSAAFLLDSESNLKAALGGRTPAAPAPSPGATR